MTILPITNSITAIQEYNEHKQQRSFCKLFGKRKILVYSAPERQLKIETKGFFNYLAWFFSKRKTNRKQVKIYIRSSIKTKKDNSIKIAQIIKLADKYFSVSKKVDTTMLLCSLYKFVKLNCEKDTTLNPKARMILSISKSKKDNVTTLHVETKKIPLALAALYGDCAMTFPSYVSMNKFIKRLQNIAKYETLLPQEKNNLNKTIEFLENNIQPGSNKVIKFEKDKLKNIENILSPIIQNEIIKLKGLQQVRVFFTCEEKSSIEARITYLTAIRDEISLKKSSENPPGKEKI